ncbi:MAG: hypothetical protein U0790_05400 [Isosphaeraceae bacterium]
MAQPVGTAVGNPLPPVTVAVFDRFGQLWSGVGVNVTLIPLGGARGRLVRGSVLNATTINGVATFSQLAITAPGRYVLRVQIGRRRVISDPFEIVPGQATGRARFSRKPLAGRTHPLQARLAVQRPMGGGHSD